MQGDSKYNILEAIKRNGGIGLDRLVDKTGLSKTTLREHMLQLERDGLVERTYHRSGPGRPGLRFELTTDGHGRFPSEERELLTDLLRFLKSEGSEAMLHTFFEKFWNKRAERAKAGMDEADDNTAESRLNALSNMLEQEGFMPEIRSGDRPDAIIIKECNCPFRSVIGETQLPCELEIAFYKKIFGSDVARTSYIPEGSHSCTYHIVPRET